MTQSLRQFGCQRNALLAATIQQFDQDDVIWLAERTAGSTI